MLGRGADAALRATLLMARISSACLPFCRGWPQRYAQLPGPVRCNAFTSALLMHVLSTLWSGSRCERVRLHHMRTRAAMC